LKSVMGNTIRTLLPQCKWTIKKGGRF